MYTAQQAQLFSYACCCWMGKIKSRILCGSTGHCAMTFTALIGGISS